MRDQWDKKKNRNSKESDDDLTLDVMRQVVDHHLYPPTHVGHSPDPAIPNPAPTSQPSHDVSHTTFDACDCGGSTCGSCD